MGSREFRLAKEKVYVAEIRKRIITADHRDNTSSRGMFVKLRDGYRDRAQEIGKLRVVQADYRTAEFLKSLEEGCVQFVTKAKMKYLDFSPFLLPFFLQAMAPGRTSGMRARAVSYKHCFQPRFHGGHGGFQNRVVWPRIKTVLELVVKHRRTLPMGMSSPRTRPSTIIIVNSSHLLRIEPWPPARTMPQVPCVCRPGPARRCHVFLRETDLDICELFG